MRSPSTPPPRDRLRRDGRCGDHVADGVHGRRAPEQGQDRDCLARWSAETARLRSSRERTMGQSLLGHGTLQSCRATLTPSRLQRSWSCEPAITIPWPRPSTRKSAGWEGSAPEESAARSATLTAGALEPDGMRAPIGTKLCPLRSQGRWRNCSHPFRRLRSRRRIVRDLRGDESGPILAGFASSTHTPTPREDAFRPRVFFRPDVRDWQ